MTLPSEPPSLSPTSQRMQARIIDAVLDMIARHGISGTTFANVAKTADVSQGVLVFHFKTREGLLAEAFRRLLSEYNETWQEAMKAPTPFERLLGLVRTDFSPKICSRKKLAVWFSFYGEVAKQPPYSMICSEAEQLRQEAILCCCRDLVAEIGHGDPDLLTWHIDCLTDGLWLALHTQFPGTNRKYALDVALDHLKLLFPGYSSQI